MVGKSPCCTPACKLWLRKRKRFIIADEKLALQGLNMRHYGPALKVTSEAVKNKLAGNSFNMHNCLVAFVAAFATLPIDWMQ